MTFLGWDLLSMHFSAIYCMSLLAFSFGSFFFLLVNLSSVTGHTVLVCSLGLPIAVFLFDSFILQTSHWVCFLSLCLLIAMCAVFMVVVLSFRLLVTKEVAPPAFRVVHLFGRPCTPHLLHLPFI